MARKLLFIVIALAVVSAALWTARKTTPTDGVVRTSTVLRGVILDTEGEPIRSHRLFARL